MTPLSDTQKQLLFDYSFGMTGERDTAEAEQLLSSSPEAVQLYEVLKAALSPLDAVEPEPCPDDLAERTIARLVEQARLTRGQGQLEQLLDAERARVPLRIPFLRNWTEIAAMAAALVLFIGVLFPAFGLARQKEWQAHCQSHFAGIYNGLAAYVNDHDGRIPTVATTPGSPWWKIGAQGPETPSNSRRGWLLVKLNYAPLAAFACPARPGRSRPDLESLPVAHYNDFPARSFIHFSVRIDGPQDTQPNLSRKRVFLTDINPLSEEFPRDLSTPASIELRGNLLTANSRNHRQRGQNVLCCDGSVEFTKTRRISSSDDDIYMLKTMFAGQRICGCERPASEDDTFVGP